MKKTNLCPNGTLEDCNKANLIKNISNDLIYKNSQKKNKKTKIILIATLVIAISIILYLVLKS